MAAPEVREVHRRAAARPRKVNLKGRAPDNVLVAEARVARQLEAEDRAWPI